MAANSLDVPFTYTVNETERLTILPIRFPALWRMYLQARDSYWLPREINLTSDVEQWSTRLTEDERHVVSRILAFFATADGIVADNLVERFSQEVQLFEAKFFYGFQVMMENIHAETYSLILLQLIQDEKARESILKAAFDVPSVSSKSRWAEKWLNDKVRPLQERLIAFACVEGIFFSASFAIIYWFKARNLLPGLCHSNDLISRDEALHTDFACILLRHLGNLPKVESVYELVADAVAVEIEFVKDSLPNSLPGLPQSDMVLYVHFVADQLLISMGYESLYGVKNPLPIMHMASMPGRTNFFERRNAEYRLPATAVGAVAMGELTTEAFAR